MLLETRLSYFRMGLDKIKLANTFSLLLMRKSSMMPAEYDRVVAVLDKSNNIATIIDLPSLTQGVELAKLPEPHDQAKLYLSLVVWTHCDDKIACGWRDECSHFIRLLAVHSAADGSLLFASGTPFEISSYVAE